RQALVALADPADPVTAELFQYRFGGLGELGGHAVGNVVLTGLAAILGDPVAALDRAAVMLGCCGRVLPMAAEPLEIEAEVVGLDPRDPGAPTAVRGQHRVATTPGHVRRVSLHPVEPAACPEAVAAVADADTLVFGPGSWFTSVIPHFLVPDLRDAIAKSPARKVLVLNLSTDGETDGWPIEGHLDALAAHAPAVTFDTVLADPGVVRDHQRLSRAAESLGGGLVVTPFALGDGSPRHDQAALAAALRTALGID
ncbi:MAG TPA: 2-phospho-L-lactate transferase CofD family protein, partial [Cryptosporangiaceae bacterium]|nr:2-phospho-L-lactate transferase CofD family protein [Cryptosporangiaceae bacterium]